MLKQYITTAVVKETEPIAYPGRKTFDGPQNTTPAWLEDFAGKQNGLALLQRSSIA
jgi:hypothetical protein